MNIKSLESISLYKQLLKNISDGIIIYNKSGSILWCNNQASEMLSKPTEKIINKKIDTFFPWFANSNKNIATFTIDLNKNSSQNFEMKKKKIIEKSYELNIIYIKEVNFSKTSKPTIKNPMDYAKKIVSYENLKFNFDNIIGQNKKLCDIKVLAKRAASTSSSILIYGETGTGKELFAQSIHNASKRSNAQFIAINCAAIPDTLLESIFFGTTKGAYTGSVDRPGLFELASNGTLFLDEINSMPLALQSKLLRVVQEGILRRVGGNKDIFVNPRIISSTNTEPFKAIEKSLLLNDLFYRLGVVCITIPPLRERKDDMLILANYFIKKTCDKLGKNYLRLSDDALNFFKQYSWPGNIRQLEHVIESTIVLIKDTEEEILLEHLPEYFRCISINNIPTSIDNNKKLNLSSLKHEVDKTERNKIIVALEESKGNISEAARNLQISRQCLYYKIKKYNINILK